VYADEEKESKQLSKCLRGRVGKARAVLKRRPHEVPPVAALVGQLTAPHAMDVR